LGWFLELLSSEISPIGELGVIGYIAITSFVACATCAAAVLPSIVTIRRFADPEPVEWAESFVPLLSVVAISYNLSKIAFRFHSGGIS
jgi:hypothetical protein